MILVQIMQNLVLEEGDIAVVRSANLPKGTFVKLQPHTQVPILPQAGWKLEVGERKQYDSSNPNGK